MTIQATVSKRLQKLPPYLFVEIDRAKRKLREEEKDVIDLGIGDPDLPTFPYIVEEMKIAVEDPRNHKYALDAGLFELRESIARWYLKRFKVSLSAAEEVFPLIGSKDGIGHLPLAFVNPDEYVLIPEPGYPGYQAGTILAGGIPYYMPLLEENNYLPDLKAIPDSVLAQAKIIYLNYPNNPTAATAERSFYQEVVSFADKHNIIVAHDAAYSEIAFDGYKPMSFLEVDGAKEVGIELHSLSKTYNMTGWRIGFVVGHKEVIAGLGRVKSNVDSGIFQAVQYAAIKALSGNHAEQKEQVRIYEERRDLLVEGLKKIGIDVKKPKATFYVWFKVPPKYTSAEFCMMLLKKCAVVVTPGNGFGKSGEGYARISLTMEKNRLKEAVERIKNVL